MGLNFLGDILGAGVGLATSLMNMELQRETNAQNYDIAMKNLGFQREQYDYQKSLNALTMEREDNATQRKMVDLIQSGLSPVLASGSGSSSATFSSAPAPQINYRKQAPQLDLNAMLQMSMLGSQIENIKANTDKTKAETDNISTNVALNKARDKRDEARLVLESNESKARVDQIKMQSDKILADTLTENELRPYQLDKLKKEILNLTKKSNMLDIQYLTANIEYGLLERYGDTEEKTDTITRWISSIAMLIRSLK